MIRLIVGLALLGAGILGLVSLQQRAHDIRAHHTTVTADVTDSHGRHFTALRVEYTYHDRAYQADLLDIGWGLPPDTGDHVILAIDPGQPSNAALPGLVSGSRWRYWYQPVGFAGIVVLLTAAWKAFRPRRGVREKEIVARILVHPRPAWADRADDKVLTVVLVNAQPPWEEELAIRRLDADTAEICCVPFLQTRLALGDVVRINARGYVGEVTRPSGRVTFAVRCAGGVTANDFAGAVVEEVGTGLLAVAASAEEAATIDARLRSWEDDGRAEYRSSLRIDRFDEPLL